MAKLADEQRAYLDEIKSSAGSDAMADALETLARSQLGDATPLDETVAIPPTHDAKPSGRLWKLLRSKRSV